MTPIPELTGARMIYIGWPGSVPPRVTFHFGRPHVDTALTGWRAPWGTTVWRLTRPGSSPEYFGFYLPHRPASLVSMPDDILKNRFAYCETPLTEVTVDNDGIMFRWVTGKRQFVFWERGGFVEQ